MLGRIGMFEVLGLLWISQSIIYWEGKLYFVLNCKQMPWFYTEKWQFCQSLDITEQLFSVKQQPKEQPKLNNQNK